MTHLFVYKNNELDPSQRLLIQIRPNVFHCST